MCVCVLIIKYVQTEFYVQEQVKKVDDNENSVFKHENTSETGCV